MKAEHESPYEKWEKKMTKMVVIVVSVMALFYGGILLLQYANSKEIGELKGDVKVLSNTVSEHNKILANTTARLNRIDSSTLKLPQYISTMKLVSLQVELLIAKSNGASSEELAPIRNEIREQKQNLWVLGIDMTSRGVKK